MKLCLQHSDFYNLLLYIGLHLWVVQVHSVFYAKSVNVLFSLGMANASWF